MHKCSVGLYFWKCTKKVIAHQKRNFGSFWRLITFFCAFPKILIKITFVRLLFLKLKQKKKKWRKCLLLQFLFQNTKCPFLGVNQHFNLFLPFIFNKCGMYICIRVRGLSLRCKVHIKQTFSTCSYIRRHHHLGDNRYISFQSEKKHTFFFFFSHDINLSQFWSYDSGGTTFLVRPPFGVKGKNMDTHFYFKGALLRPYMLVVEEFFFTHALWESWCRPQTANIAKAAVRIRASLQNCI